jgi:hypothetical protein
MVVMDWLALVIDKVNEWRKYDPELTDPEGLC